MFDASHTHRRTYIRTSHPTLLTSVQTGSTVRTLHLQPGAVHPHMCSSAPQTGCVVGRGSWETAARSVAAEPVQSKWGWQAARRANKGSMSVAGGGGRLPPVSWSKAEWDRSESAVRSRSRRVRGWPVGKDGGQGEGWRK